MQVILKKEVKGVGKAGDVKNVSVGFARNYLLPQKLALIASPEELTKASARTSKAAKILEKQKKNLSEISSKITNIKVVIKSKASGDGKLYAGIHSKEISEAIQEQHNMTLDASMIQLDSPIKKIGEHEIKVVVEGKEYGLKCFIEGGK